MKRLLSVTGILAALAGIASPASAEILATRYRTVDFVIGFGAGVSIPTNNGGSALTPFVTTVDNQRVVIEYNAECTVTSGSSITWVSVRIIVDGIQAAPSSVDKAHCTASGAAGTPNWVSAVATAIFVVPEPGIHTVRLEGQLQAGAAGNTARLDDSTIVISR